MLLKVIEGLVFGYVGLLIIVYLLQAYLVFAPSHKQGNAQMAKLLGYQVVQYTTKDGLSLVGWYHPPKGLNQPVIVFFHGNAGVMSDRAHWMQAYMKEGFGVFLPEYRGYGGNPGKLSEENIYADARGAIAFLHAQGVQDKCIVIYGESLGSGVAVQMAVEHDYAALMLQSPYTSLVHVGQRQYPFLPVRWLLTNRFESIKKVDKLNEPVYIFHGRDDNLVPVELGQALFDAFPGEKYIKLFDAAHNDMPIKEISALAIPYIKNHACKGLKVDSGL